MSSQPTTASHTRFEHVSSRLSERSTLAMVGIGCLLLAGITAALLRHESHPTGDEPFYVLMARHPGAAHSFPYADRIAVPWLVHVLPFSLNVSFMAQALVCIGAAGGAMYALLRHFSISPATAAGLALGLAISPNLLVVLLRDGRSIDPATTLIMILGCLFICRRQRLALALTVAVGVAVKETSLFLLPLTYAVWARRLFDRDALRDTVAVSIGPVVVYAALRVAVPAIGSSYTSVGGGSFLSARLDNVRAAISGAALRRAADAFGPLWLVAPLALRSFRFGRRGLTLVALCVLSLTVSYDTGRVLFLAAPVVYASAAWVVRHRRVAARALVVCLLALDFGYAAYMQVHGVRYGLDTTPPAPIPLR